MKVFLYIYFLQIYLMFSLLNVGNILTNIGELIFIDRNGYKLEK